jgi:uncharacterized protein (TIGR00290 family)
MSEPDQAPGACAVSWSGGKDSMLALLRARAAGAATTVLLTMCDDAGASLAHALPPALLQAQAAALGVELRAVPVAPGHYAAAFGAALRALRARGIGRMVFGDIDLQAHRDWIEAACAAAGVAPWFPLWGEARASLAREVVARGIRAHVVCVDCSRLAPHGCARAYDAAFLDALPSDVCPCGEDGEFHTFVHDAPGFAAPLPIRMGPVRIVASQPPLAPTRLALSTPLLDLAAAPPERSR